MSREAQRVCPVERAGSLDNKIRRWFQNPAKILGVYIKEGMTALDIGCGPGFFTIDLARMVGASGRVIAADLQEGMLQKVRDKIEGTSLEKRIVLHRSESGRIGVPEVVDFALAFYVVHEIPDQDSFFKEIGKIVAPGGHLLVVEPPFHVSKKAFEQTLQTACGAGFEIVERPGVLLSKAALLKRTGIS